MRRFITSLLGAVVAVVTVGGLVLGVAGTPSSDDGATGAVLGQAEDAPAAEDGAAEAPVEGELSELEQLLEQLGGPGDGSDLPTVQRVLLSRDPFRPVVPTSDGGGGGGGNGGSDGGTDGGTNGGTDGGTNGGTDGGTNGGTDGGTDGGDDDACSGDDQEQVCDGVVVTLDGFTDDGLAIVSVDGTAFTVGIDDEFATSFRVLAINDPCATLLFGDEAFSICVGATVLK